jgi:hypothetical protein
MLQLSRRRALTLASFVMASPLLGTESRAEQAAVPGSATFEMATFTATSGGDADAAFAKAIAAIAKSAVDAGKAGPVHIVLNLEKNFSYRIKRPLAFRQLHGFELNGNGAQLINMARTGSLAISAIASPSAISPSTTTRCHSRKAPSPPSTRARSRSR